MSSKLLRKSKIANFMKILSDEQAIKKLLSESGDDSDIDISKNEKALSLIADLLQSLTNDALLIDEIFSKIIEEYGEDEEIIKYLKKHIYVIKSSKKNKNYHFLKNEDKNKINKLDYPFYIKKNNKKYGFPGIEDIPSLVQKEGNEYKYVRNKKYSEIYGLEAITSVKLNLDDQEGNEQKDATIATRFRDINEYDETNGPTKESPSLSSVLVNNPFIRIGTRNTLELATFFNVLSTVELSKCVPYFNATFSLPDRVNKQNDRASFNVGTVNQFLDGTQFNSTTSLYNSFKSPTSNKGKPGTNGNLALFTMPQTYNNMNEEKGHYENVANKLGALNNRITPVHDPTKPFMTLTSFKIDVAPTKGLMSFKSGKLSLILHDRTRMNDIAPFIKPDLFGSFGSEITVTYGWSHIEGYEDLEETDDLGRNPIAKFLNDSKVTEKYIIVNSSFSIDKTGQVNIELSIAAKGPIDFRNVQVESDFEGKKVQNRISVLRSRLQSVISRLQSKITTGDNVTYSPLFSSRGTNNTSFADYNALNESVLSYENYIKKNSTKQKKEYRNTINNANKIIKIFKKSTISEGILELIQFINKNSRELSFIGKADFNSLELFLDDNNNLSRAFAYESTIKEYIKLYRSLAINYLAFDKEFKRKKASYDKTVKKIISGIEESDPFYDKEIHLFLKNLDDPSFNLAKSKKPKKIKNFYEDTDGIFKNKTKIITDQELKKIKNKKQLTKIKNKKEKIIFNERTHTTFGAFLTALLGTHLASTNKYDEVQMIFYTANEYSGAFSCRNLSSLLIEKQELGSFLREEFIKFNVMTMESIISSVIQRFISVKDQKCFGLSNFFRRTENRQIKFKNKSKGKEFNQEDIDSRLKRIYSAIGGEKTSEENEDNFNDVRFKMPSVHFTFDSFTNREKDRTICRISIFDRNDNPFSSLNTFLKDVNNSNVIRISNQINKIRKNALSANKQYAEALRAFNERSIKFVNNLIEKGKIVETPSGSGIFAIKENNGLSVVKEEFKSVLPSLTLGTQNSGIIETSISTINEGKLNTIFLTRPDRNKNLNTLITNANLPLRVLPAQATLTTFGCPWVNFAQMIFLDFETGTSIDNQYNVTAISHDLTPGNFSTSLTLSYGDVYGKYENAASVISRALNKTQADKKAAKQEKEEKEIFKVSISENSEISYSNKSLGRVIYDDSSEDISNVRGFATIIKIAKDNKIENNKSVKYILKRNKYANLNKKYVYEATILCGSDVDEVEIENKNIFSDQKILKGIREKEIYNFVINFSGNNKLKEDSERIGNYTESANIYSLGLYDDFNIKINVKDIKKEFNDVDVIFTPINSNEDIDIKNTNNTLKIFSKDIKIEAELNAENVNNFYNNYSIDIVFKDMEKVYEEFFKYKFSGDWFFAEEVEDDTEFGLEFINFFRKYLDIGFTLGLRDSELTFINKNLFIFYLKNKSLTIRMDISKMLKDSN